MGCIYPGQKTIVFYDYVTWNAGATSGLSFRSRYSAATALMRAESGPSPAAPETESPEVT